MSSRSKFSAFHNNSNKETSGKDNIKANPKKITSDKNNKSENNNNVELDLKEDTKKKAIIKDKNFNNLVENIKSLVCHYCKQLVLEVYCLKCPFSKDHTFCQTCVNTNYVNIFF